MNDNNIDKFREEIRKRLRETKNETSDAIIANHSKFNEELEFHLENMEGDLPPNVYDLLIQSANFAYMKGVHAGLASGNERTNRLSKVVSGLKNQVDSNRHNPTNTDLQDINKTIHGLAGIILIGIVTVVVILLLR